MVLISHDAFHGGHAFAPGRASAARNLNWRLIGALGLNLGLWTGGLWAAIACIRAL